MSASIQFDRFRWVDCVGEQIVEFVDDLFVKVEIACCAVGLGVGEMCLGDIIFPTLKKENETIVNKVMIAKTPNKIKSNRPPAYVRPINEPLLLIWNKAIVEARRLVPSEPANCWTILKIEFTSGAFCG